MTSNLSVEHAVLKAIKKVRPDKIKKDGLTKLSRATLDELHKRVKNML